MIADKNLPWWSLF